MVKVFPFEGIYYNKTLLKDLTNVFTPPYDVISPAEQEAYYNVNDFNFIRIALGKEFPDDGPYNNKYVRSAAFMDGWIRHQILLRDKKPAFYIYEQRFTINNKKYARIGFICLIRLEDIGKSKILPHEATHSKAKIDRLEIMKATSANLESIFSFYSDEKKKVQKVLKTFMKKKPLINITDKDKIKHQIWRIDRKPSLAKIMKEMKDKTVFIADGHHRYEAAIRYRNELKQKNTKFSEDEVYNHVMMYLTCLEDEGLVVLPINRVLKNIGFFEKERFEADLANYFEIEPYPATKKTATKVRNKLLKDLEKKGQAQHCFGMYLGKNHYYLLTLKDENIMEKMIEGNRPHAWKTLDTNILHYIVFDRILGIAHQLEDKVQYVKEAAETIELVDQNEKAQAGFLLNSVKVETITEIASELEKMPQKTTYFYPKLLSGLVMNKIKTRDKVTL
ncbi:MAG: DUF1015 domain-containing protein [bacterium]